MANAPWKVAQRRTKRKQLRTRLTMKRSTALETDGKTVTWKCHQCDHVYKKAPKGWDRVAAGFKAKLMEYWSRGGCGSLCPKCMRQAERDLDEEISWEK